MSATLKSTGGWVTLAGMLILVLVLVLVLACPVFEKSFVCWSTHINSILKKVTRRMYFLKQQNRAGLSSTHLLEYSIAVIRPVLEYWVPFWHHALTKEQSTKQRAKSKDRSNTETCHPYHF